MSAHPALRPYARGDIRAVTAEEATALDRSTVDALRVPERVLMENAGRAAAQVLARLFPEGPVVGVVGAGNNGGDALVLLRALRTWGREVCAVLAADRPRSDLLLHGWSVGAVIDTVLDEAAWVRLLASSGVVVDGVLGTGGRDAPRARQAEVIRHVNRAARPVLALDVPSGIDATTGAVPGEAVRADVTVAFGAPKLGSLLHPARALVGRLVAVEIGFGPSSAEVGATLVTPTWARAVLPRRPSETHKKAVGSLLLLAGQAGMAGAALLAARAAFRSGVGLVRVASAPENRSAIQGALPEAIYVDASDGGALAAALAESDAVAAGPGLGTGSAAAAQLAVLVEGPHVPTVLDADALNVTADGRLDLAALARTRPVLLTPHPGEMARLLGEEAEPSRRVATLRAAVERYGCAVLLKGAPSLVAAPGAPLLVDTQGSSDLAVAGMGDALTGVCGALMAQRLRPLEAGASALYLTGRAARLAGRGAALMPSDVIRLLPDALVEDGEATSDLGLAFVTFDADPAR